MGDSHRNEKKEKNASEYTGKICMHSLLIGQRRNMYVTVRICIYDDYTEKIERRVRIRGDYDNNTRYMSL